MAFWFLSGLRRGVVTTRYPRRPEPSAADLPTPPEFVPSLLSIELADHLVERCPSRCLRREGAVLHFDVGACSACGVCIEASKGAARPSGFFELAATRRDQLVKKVPINGSETGSLR